MRIRLSLAVCGAALLLTLSAAAQGTPNFTGTWTLDAPKSDFGMMPPPESIVMVIDHNEPGLKVAVTQKGPQGEASNTSTYTTDGKDNVNKMRGPAGEQDITSTTKWNGKALETKRVLEAQGMSIGIDESMELAADSRVLTMTRVIKTPQGDFTQKAVFNKQ
jgi:hypothetical protein